MHAWLSLSECAPEDGLRLMLVSFMLPIRDFPTFGMLVVIYLNALLVSIGLVQGLCAMSATEPCFILILLLVPRLVCWMFSQYLTLHIWPCWRSYTLGASWGGAFAQFHWLAAFL